jgi:kynurenine 3-monooxygenase
MMSKVLIVGSGLVGCLLAVLLHKRGHAVTLCERRADPRRAGYVGGRSINLALSDRGLLALRMAGLADDVAAVSIPLPGRLVHGANQQTSFFNYGLNGEAIHSVSRGGLNIRLLDIIDSLGIDIRYEHRCHEVRLAVNEADFVDASGAVHTLHGDVILGCDGAYSAVRGALQKTDRFEYSQSYLPHGYKELAIEAGPDGSARLDRNALHIWPRQSYMLIALPNLDNSFTCTLFFPFEGEPSFASLQAVDDAEAFFARVFPSAHALMPDFREQWNNNPVSSLITVRCEPWGATTANGQVLLLGDAAHAIVPFFGQGMNAGFEDARVLASLLDEHGQDWSVASKEFQRMRKPHADAIATLALDNFVEMRDLVQDPTFQLKKRIEAAVARACPGQFVPSYTMVTFRPDLSYATALARARAQDVILQQLMGHPSVVADPTSAAHEALYRTMAASLPPLQPDMR